MLWSLCHLVYFYSMFIFAISLALALLLLLALSAAYAVFLKRKEEELDHPKIHASGSFSIVRQSPRSLLEKNMYSDEEIAEVLVAHHISADKETIQKYSEHWKTQLGKNTSVIEEGDTSGVQTFQYIIPENEKSLCPDISGENYVTREQLQNFPNLIPPYYLGSNICLAPKQAWDTKLNGKGWKPLLPDRKGKYPTPKRGLVVPL